MEKLLDAKIALQHEECALNYLRNCIITSSHNPIKKAGVIAISENRIQTLQVKKIKNKKKLTASLEALNQLLFGIIYLYFLKEKETSNGYKRLYNKN